MNIKVTDLASQITTHLEKNDDEKIELEHLISYNDLKDKKIQDVLGAGIISYFFISNLNDRTQDADKLVFYFINVLRGYIITSNKINNETTVQDVYNKIKLLYSKEHNYNYLIYLKVFITNNKDFFKNKEIKIQDVLGDQEGKDFISNWNNRTNNTDYLVLKLINMLKNKNVKK